MHTVLAMQLHILSVETLFVLLNVDLALYRWQCSSSDLFLLPSSKHFWKEMWSIFALEPQEYSHLQWQF